MDHLRFVFSLLLIVSVTTTTFGSVIKANNPNGKELKELRSHLSKYPEMAPNRKELEALLKRLNPGMKNDAEDQDHEKSKRKVDAGALVRGKDLTPDLLKEEDVHADQAVQALRNLVITLENWSGYAWQSPNVYFLMGKAGDRTLIDPLNTGKSTVYHAQSNTASEGISGLLTYYIPQINSTLSVMFSLPFQTNSFDNLWNVQLNSENDKTDCEEFLYAYFTNPFGEKPAPPQKLSHGLQFFGTLGVTTDEDTLTIVVQPAAKK